MSMCEHKAKNCECRKAGEDCRYAEVVLVTVLDPIENWKSIERKCCQRPNTLSDSESIDRPDFCTHPIKTARFGT